MSTKKEPGTGKKPPRAGMGRPKGSINKENKALREMILQALDESGGVGYLVDRANDPKTAAAFLSLIGKVLPTTLAGDPNAPVIFKLDATWLNQSILQRNS